MKRYTFVLLSVFVCFTTIYSQSKSAIEFYDTTGNEPASRIGWTGDKDNGHFFIATPGEEGEIKVQNGNLEVNGTVKAEKFEGDGSGLTNLPCSSNGVAEINITDAAVNEDGELVFELSDGETIEAGVVRGADGVAGINWRGTWDNEKTYKKRDAVFYEGSSYYAADDPAGVPGTDNSWSIIAKKGDKGEPGSGGTGSGVSVTGASIDEDGKLVLELSDGNEITAGVVKGTDGANGKDGSDGSDGKDGISISNATINGDGELVLKFDDGDSTNVGVVKGETGEPGPAGTTSWTGIGDIPNRIIFLSDSTFFNANSNRNPAAVWNEYSFNYGLKNKMVIISAGHLSTEENFGKIEIKGTNSISLNSANGYSSKISGNLIIGNYENGKPDELLFVGGNVKCDTLKTDNIIVKGTALNVPDYVFEDNYNLKNLHEIKSFIKKHKHLPDVQNAKDIAGKGMDIVKMNLDLLRKVEELTLYILEQNEEVNKLKSEMEYLKQKLNN